jgi:hypothetical protein
LRTEVKKTVWDNVRERDLVAERYATGRGVVRDGGAEVAK